MAGLPAPAGNTELPRTGLSDLNMTTRRSTPSPIRSAAPRPGPTPSIPGRATFNGPSRVLATSSTARSLGAIDRSWFLLGGKAPASPGAFSLAAHGRFRLSHDRESPVDGNRGAGDEIGCRR